MPLSNANGKILSPFVSLGMDVRRDLNTAMDYYFTHYAEKAAAVPKVKEANIQKLFQQYMNEESKVMDDEGIEKFYAAMGVNAETDIVVLWISRHMEAENIGEYTWSEFLKGCQKLGVDSISGFKSILPGLYNDLKQEDKYKETYKFTFSFASARNYKNVDKAIAIALWTLFFGKKCSFLNLWEQFLEDEKKNL